MIDDVRCVMSMIRTSFIQVKERILLEIGGIYHSGYVCTKCKLLATEIPELIAPSRVLLELLNHQIKLGADARADLTQRSHSTQRTPLQLRRALEILLHRVLGNICALHGLLQLRCGFFKALSNGRRSNLRQAEEHHMRDDLDFVRIVRKPRNDAPEELVQVKLRQTSIKL